MFLKLSRRGFITDSKWSGGRLSLSGDIEVIDTFQRSYRLERTPLKSVPVDILRRAAPECRYLVTDESGRALLSGSVPLCAEAKFHIDLNNRLPAGHTISALIAVNGNVMNAELHRRSVLIPSQH